MQRILTFILICLSAIYCAMCIFTITQPKPKKDIVQQYEKLCPKLDNSEGTAAENLFNQLCERI